MQIHVQGVSVRERACVWKVFFLESRVSGQIMDRFFSFWVSRWFFWGSVSRGLGVLGSLFVLSFCLACESSVREGDGLLAELEPVKQEGVRNAQRINDGLVPRPGTSWNSNRTATFAHRGAYVDYDLGRVAPIAAFALLGDNNDRYGIFGSLDGETYEKLAEAEAVRESGLRWRSQSDLGKQARFIRLQPVSGDASLSVAEFALYESTPAVLPAEYRVVSARDAALSYRSSLLVFGFFVLLAVGGLGVGAPWWLKTGLLALVGWSLGQYLLAWVQAYPVGQLEVSLTRAVSAVLACGVMLRQLLGSEKYRPWKILQYGVLSMAALLSVSSFYNLGYPQFFDHKNAKPSVVHNYDMRVYFPVAKYFDELKYDGLYLASVASYAEENGGLDTAEMRRAELRDLHTHRMRPVSEVHAELAEVRSRFSPERWEEFKTDMRYFWETMGSWAYLGSMADHGGNATPVWLALATLLFGSAQASNEVLTAAALLDPLLLLIFAVVVARTFGVATALLSLVVYGANDFYMFGSNWAGATLRNDWMVYLGLGVCALRVGRFGWGGALLALSALIRAFPAIALLALGVPLLYGIAAQYQEENKLPSWKQIYQKQRWFFQAALGATACVLVSVLASSLILGWDAWPLWVKKIASFTASPHVNHISLLTVVAGSENNQALVLRERLPLFWGLTILYVVLAGWAAYRRPPSVAALLGILLMPVFMYPANYYLHCVFLIPLLLGAPQEPIQPGEERPAAWVNVLALLMCAALYFTVKEQSLALHFYNASVILMATIGALFYVLLPRDAQGQWIVPEFLKQSRDSPEG